MSAMMIVQFLVLTFVVSGVLIFFLKKSLVDSTQGAVNRLNRETEQVRAKQAELNEKIKQANEELERRKKEADELVAKMSDQAEEQAKAEREKIINSARQQSEEIISKAQNTKEDMRKVIRQEVQMETADYAAQYLTNILSARAKDALHHCLIEDFIDELEKVDMKVITVDIPEAEVITPTAITDAHQKKLAEVLKNRLGRDVALKNTVEPEIISGLILKLGSLNLDASLRNFLAEEATAKKEKIERS